MCVDKFHKEEFKQVDGINYDVYQRFIEAKPRHPKTWQLFNRLVEIDKELYGNFFHWNDGCDGSATNYFLTQLDIFFEEQDILKTTKF